MVDKYHSDTLVKERIESIVYTPAVQNSGDLEAGTHTIVPTARPAIASAQYNLALTLSKPGDARLVVTRIAARLSVNIAGLGTATHVYCSVRVDVDDADHELFFEDWTTTGAKLDVVDAHSANKATIFNLLKDGGAHTFYFLFWADVASQATIDVVQLWEGVGHCGTPDYAYVALSMNLKGFASLYLYVYIVGSGSAGARLTNENMFGTLARTTGELELPCVLLNNHSFTIGGTVATDLYYLHGIHINFRSEQ